MTKQEWRTQAKRRRAAAVDAEAHVAVCAAIRAWAPYAEASVVLSYLAFGTELDVGALFADPREWCVTRTSRGLLSVRPYEPERLERHRYGFRQPPADAQVIDPARVDLVLVPGLLFDRSGTRLGYGKGHYDRLLPSLRPDALRVGVAFELLEAGALPVEPTDAPMTHVVTRAGVVEVGA